MLSFCSHRIWFHTSVFGFINDEFFSYLLFFFFFVRIYVGLFVQVAYKLLICLSYGGVLMLDISHSCQEIVHWLQYLDVYNRDFGSYYSRDFDVLCSMHDATSIFAANMLWVITSCSGSVHHYITETTRCDTLDLTMCSCFSIAYLWIFIPSIVSKASHSLPKSSDLCPPICVWGDILWGWVLRRTSLQVLVWCMHPFARCIDCLYSIVD